MLVFVTLLVTAQNVTFSTEEEPVYYVVRFASGNFLNAPGNGAKCVTTDAPSTPGTLWAFIGTLSNFKMVANNGQWLGYTSDRFCGVATKSSAKSMKFYTRKDGAYELMQTASTYNGKGMNQWGAIAVGQELGMWNNEDGNNSLTIVEASEIDMTDYSALKEKAATEYTTISSTATYTSLPEEVNPLRVWFNKPGTKTGVSNVWMEYSQPIGNGPPGASLFGGVYCDELQFNEKSLWTGKSEIRPNATYGHYRNFGSLYVIEEGDLDLTKSNPVSKYVRYLDIEDAIGGVRFVRGGLCCRRVNGRGRSLSQ